MGDNLPILMRSFFYRVCRNFKKKLLEGKILKTDELLYLDFLPERFTLDEALCTKHLKSTEIIIIEITSERWDKMQQLLISLQQAFSFRFITLEHPACKVLPLNITCSLSLSILAIQVNKKF